MWAHPARQVSSGCLGPRGCACACLSLPAPLEKGSPFWAHGALTGLVGLGLGLDWNARLAPQGQWGQGGGQGGCSVTPPTEEQGTP